jgi:uncharacterized protein (TIGR03437 family)
MWLFVLTPVAMWGQSAGFKAKPAAVSFSYTAGDAKLPAPLVVAVSVSSGTPPVFNSSVAGGPWLTVSPAAGTTPASLKVNANPTSLAVGTYSGTITLTTSESTPQTTIIDVTLMVKAPPPTLSAAPTPLSVTYVRGDPAPTPLPLTLTTSGALISYTAAAAGGKWLAVTPKSGAVFPAFGAALQVAVSPSDLAPGTYKGTINITAAQASNKSQSVTVNLTVNAGPPTLNTIWPATVTAGAGATTITLSGDNFYSGSIVKAGTTTLSSTLIGPNVMTAAIPSSMLSSTGTLNINVSNAGPGGGESATKVFTIASATPTIGAAVNAASFQTGAIAPGEMITIFGTGLGPDLLTVFIPPSSGGSIATTLAGTRVLFDTTAASVIYTSAGQVSVMTPYNVAGKSTVQLKVEYNSVQSAAVPMNVAVSAPGVFTSSGSGTGGIIAFNFDETTSTYTLNSDSALAPKGSIIVFYATGEGVTSPASTDGQIVAAPASTPNPAVTVQVGGKDATVLYTGGIVGLVAGLMQINARIPTDVAPGKAIPAVVTINGITSQPGITIGVK